MNKPGTTKLSRRKFFLYVSAAAVVTAVPVYIIRTSYPRLKGWNGKFLSKKQAYVIMAACEVILPDKTDEPIRRSIAENVDRYCFTLPEDMSSQLNLLFTVVEHFTFLDLKIKRFTRLTIEERESFLIKLKKSESDLRLVYKTLRDLCMMGYYQMDVSWEGIDYTGPLVVPGKREMAEKYAVLVAKQNELPKSLIK